MVTGLGDMGNRAVKVLNSEVVGSTNESETQSGSTARTRRFGVFELDLRAGELRRNGIKVKLQEQPFQVLAQLLETPGDVVTREDLRNRLWPADTFVDFDHSLNAAIKRLRDALGDSAENPTFVETVARRGYRFLSPVSTATNGNGTLVVATPTTESSSAALPVQPVKHSPAWWVVAGVSAVVLVLVGVKLGLLLSSRHAPAPQVRVTRLTANPADDRVLSAAISRDGKYLVFSDETGFYLRQIDTSETHPLSLPQGLKAGSVSWFPDSVHMVAALWRSGQPASLWEISSLGGTARKLLDDAHSPAVSPDGKQIAFIANLGVHQQIWLMGSDGSQAHKLVGEEGDYFGAVTWAPDSTRIAYTRSRYSYAFGVRGIVELVDVRDQRVNTVLQVNATGWYQNLDGPLAWLPDGHLIYTQNEPPPLQLDSNLWLISLDPGGHMTGTPLRLTSDSGSVSSITVSADGKRVAYLKGIPQPDVYIAKVLGHDAISEPQRLTLDDHLDLPFDWTPDNKAVLFISDRTGILSLYRQGIDQTVPELLVGGSRPIMTPRLSPDGTQLLYLVYPNWSDKTATSSLMRMPLAGGAPQKLLEANFISNQQCARAPATVCLYSMTANGEFLLYSYDPLKGTTARVYSIKDSLSESRNWSVSPDGTMLAIGAGKQGDEASPIRLVSLKTGTEKSLTVSGSPRISCLDWAADGKSLWLSSAGDEENTLLNVDLQGHARPVWHPKNMTVRWAIPSRDGKYLALHVSSSSANVWMLERP
jgi:Tol biopolymer transport system component/DNA-binding winged helix-turn-helix (wHTH) protein